MIGLWGARKAGKTVFLASIYYAVTSQVDKGWLFQGQNEEKEGRFIVETAKLLSERRWPDRGDPQAVLEPYKFNIQMPAFWGMSRTQDELDFIDPSGEVFDNPEAHTSAANIVFNSIRLSKGMIMLLDPEEENKQNHFKNLLLSFTRIRKLLSPDSSRAIKMIDMPVALCFTKMDTQPEDKIKDIDAFALDKLGKVNVNTIKSYLSNYRYFGVSSMGYGNIDILGNGDTVPNNIPEPFNVLECLKWVLSSSRKYVVPK